MGSYHPSSLFPQIFNRRMNYFIVILATGFGVGYSPVVPGTLGTLVAVPLYLVLSLIFFPIYELSLVTFFFLSVWVSDQVQKYFGKKDDPRIVIDEIMGFLVTMLWNPRTPLFVLIGFVLFRFFDILKPFPIRRFENAKGGFGVVLDDVMAGVYANIVLHLIGRITPWS